MLFCVLSTGLLQISIAQAQTVPSTTAPKTESLEHEFFKNILKDQKAIWTSPFSINRGDAKWMVPSGLGLAALITTDRITGDEMAEANRQVNVSKAISYIGATY